MPVGTPIDPSRIIGLLGPDRVWPDLRHNPVPRPQAERSMSNPTAIVAEDEATLRHQLVEQLGQLWPELTIMGEAADGVQALRLLDEHRPDVMFLDIQMPGATGLEVAREASGRCHVVFVTAYDQHAVAAFDQGAVDYVLKPVSAARLFTAVSRVKQRLGTPPAHLEPTLAQIGAPAAAARQYLRWINASVGQNLKLITVDEIAYFQADNKYTRVVTVEGEALIRKPLKELVEELDPNQFWQIHRSTLVNATSIAGVTRDFRGRMLVKLKSRQETLLVSDSYTHLFRQM
jgi:DNA-binding LytR/AlgR family response regulator